MMALGGQHQTTLATLDEPTRVLVRLAAAVSAASEEDVRAALEVAGETVPVTWIEELLLQTYLFAGFPRALNAMREWRRVAPTPVAETDDRGVGDRAAGDTTCRMVYGAMYDRLRHNIRALHPALDDWMIEEGYGKVLSRPGLDLGRRELCIVAACAATGQDRQLHSHLHGARNVGLSDRVIEEAVEALGDTLSRGRHKTLRLLWQRVRGK